MISISHWGMFRSVRPPIMANGFKLEDIEAARCEWNRPDGFIKLTPLRDGEIQPIYHLGQDDFD